MRDNRESDDLELLQYENWLKERSSDEKMPLDPHDKLGRLLQNDYHQKVTSRRLIDAALEWLSNRFF